MCWNFTEIIYRMCTTDEIIEHPDQSIGYFFVRIYVQSTEKSF